MPKDIFEFFREARPLDVVSISFVAGTWLILFFYNLIFYIRLAFHKIPGSGTAVVPVSVIIVERNEEENLNKNLPGWVDLGYPDYEVLVVDDFSEDNSLTVVGVMRQNSARLKLTGLSQETRYSEKLSRNLALKAAGFDKVVFITPDMVPPDNHWLPAIATAFYNSAEVVVGYTRYKRAKGLFHKFFRTESFYQQIESMSYCLNGMPFVTKEENVTFNKKAYFDINGFAGKIGEEFLNMEMIYNQIIRRKKNAVLISGNLTLLREMVAGKHDYWDLIHKSFILRSYLNWKIRFFKGFSNLLKILYLPLLAACVILYPVLWPVVAGLFLILAIIRLVSIKKLQNRLGDQGIFLLSVLYGIFVPYLKIFANWRYSYKRKNP